MSFEFVTNDNLFQKVIAPIANTKTHVWIGTADIKDMHVHHKGKVKSFLEILNELSKKRVKIRLLHAKEPGENFRKSFDKYPLLWKSLERQLCPRVHFKIIVIDGKMAYMGSANLTGAGLGIKSKDTRNFESGIITSDPILVEKIMNQFDEVWMGKFCKNCKRKDYCNDPII